MKKYGEIKNKKSNNKGVASAGFSLRQNPLYAVKSWRFSMNCNARDSYPLLLR